MVVMADVAAAIVSEAAGISVVAIGTTVFIAGIMRRDITTRRGAAGSS